TLADKSARQTASRDDVGKCASCSHAIGSRVPASSTTASGFRGSTLLRPRDEARDPQFGRLRLPPRRRFELVHQDNAAENAARSQPPTKMFAAVPRVEW